MSEAEKKQPSNEAPTKANDGDNARASWNISGDDVAKNTQAYEARGRTALRAVFQLATLPDYCMHVEDVAKEIGISKNVLFDKLLKYNYRDPVTKEKRGPSVKMVKAMENWIVNRQKEIELIQQRQQIGRIPFVKTPTAERIWKAGEVALDYQVVVIISGRSHIGKSVPVQRFCNVKNHGLSTYVQCQSSSGVQGLCKLFCKARRISDKGGYDTLKERVLDSIGYGDFVAVDEMTKLLTTYQKGSRLRALEFIRDIYDERHVGMLWVVTKIWKKEIQEGELSTFLEQFNRRAPIEVQLGDTPLVGDARAFFHAYGLDFPNAYKGENWENLKARYRSEPVFAACHDILHYYGLKHFETTILAGRKLAEKRNEDFDWKHVIKQHDAFELLRKEPKA